MLPPNGREDVGKAALGFSPLAPLVPAALMLPKSEWPVLLGNSGVPLLLLAAPAPKPDHPVVTPLLLLGEELLLLKIVTLLLICSKKQTGQLRKFEE